MMRDKHMGYQQWFMPDNNVLPPLRYVSKEESSHQFPFSPVSTQEYGIEAIHYDRNISANGMSWQFLPDLGRGEGCMGIDLATGPSDTTGRGPRLEYDLDIDTSGTVKIAIAILPTQDVQPERGLRLGIQMDDGTIQILDARRGLVDTFDEYTPQNLAHSRKLKPLPPIGTMALNGYGRLRRNEVFDNMRWLDAIFEVTNPGKHIVKIIMIDPEIVVERLVINPDDNCYSYFGPPEK